ncbi:MAG: Hpt domain-containing protein [Acetatifactor sp.]|nr:Hpt domain-containing protein [Acetatifactor sp.]
MTLRECYEKLNGDFEGTLGRLSSEKLVEKFVLKFLADDSFALLEESMRAGNYSEAFRASHTLKGVGLNLGFTKLYEVSDELTEALRNGEKPENEALLERVKEEYQRTINAIQELQNG